MLASVSIILESVVIPQLKIYTSRLVRNYQMIKNYNK